MARNISYNGGAVTAHYRKMGRYIAEDRANEKKARASWSKEQKSAQKAIVAQNAIKSQAVADQASGIISYDDMRAIVIAANKEIESLRASANFS